MKLLVLCLCLSFPAFLPAAPKNVDVENLRTEVEELRMVVRTLRAENERLEVRNRRLMDDILQLGRQVQALRPTVIREAEPPPVPVAEKPVNEFPVIYVNAQWHYLILNAGSAQGIKEGADGRILRGIDTVVGPVKITDVKAAQSVAELDPAALAGQGMYPKPGDRVAIP